MKLWKRLTSFFRPAAQGCSFALDQELQLSLQSLAEQEQRTLQEVAADLIRAAMQVRQYKTAAWRRWQALSPREQEVAALVCRAYTTRQAAARLGIAPETVKTHVHSILIKFGAGSRQELRQQLAGWDFSAWE